MMQHEIVWLEKNIVWTVTMSTCLIQHNLDPPIFNLPEEIFRKIFSYLNAEDLHFNLKHTCQKMTNYVANFEQTFMTLFQKSNKDIPMKAVYTIKFASKRPLFNTKVTIPNIPHQQKDTRLLFACTIFTMVVIGVDYSGYLQLFRLEGCRWIRIYRHQSKEIPTTKTKQKTRKTYSLSYKTETIWSQIGKSSIILFHIVQEEENTIGLLHFYINEVDLFILNKNKKKKRFFAIFTIV